MNNFFKSENFLAGIIMLALLNNIEHVATTYYQLSRKVLPVVDIGGILVDFNAIQAVCAILILDFAIIAFVVRGKHLIALIYAAALFAIQLFYPLDFTEIDGELPIWAATVLFSGMFSYTIYEFSKLYSEESSKNAAIARKLREKEERMTDRVAGRNGKRRKERVAERKGDWSDDIQAGIERPAKRSHSSSVLPSPSSILCQCGRSFKSMNAFNAHSVGLNNEPCTKETGKALVKHLNGQAVRD